MITSFESARSAISFDISPASAKAAISVATRRLRKAETSRSADTSRDAQGSPRVLPSSRYAVCDRPSAEPISSDMFTPMLRGERSATKALRSYSPSTMS